MFPTLRLFFPRTPLLAAALVILAIVVAAEVVRLRTPRLNQWMVRWLRPLMKEQESRVAFDELRCNAVVLRVVGHH